MKPLAVCYVRGSCPIKNARYHWCTILRTFGTSQGGEIIYVCRFPNNGDATIAESWLAPIAAITTPKAKA